MEEKKKRPRGRPRKVPLTNFYEGSLGSQEKTWFAVAVGIIGEDLSQEIAAARVILKRMIAIEGNEKEALSAILAVGRMVEANHRVSAARPEGLLEAVDVVLSELGLGTDNRDS